MLAHGASESVLRFRLRVPGTLLQQPISYLLVESNGGL